MITNLTHSSDGAIIVNGVHVSVPADKFADMWQRCAEAFNERADANALLDSLRADGCDFTETFDSRADMVDVTSLHRPDTGWVTIDSNGHEHRWYAGSQPATSYDPSVSYATPTLVWVKDGEEFWEDDDEPHDIGHLECRQCGEHVEPRYTSDATRQYIPGMKWFFVNGEPVSLEDFTTRLTAAKARWSRAGHL